MLNSFDIHVLEETLTVTALDVTAVLLTIFLHVAANM